MKREPRPAIERFTEKYIVVESGCWMWTSPPNESGYGWFSINRSQHVGAHRWSYEHHIELIPDGLTLDHLCHSADASCAGGVTCPHRRCVNPAHLEPVTRGENQRRGVRATAFRCAQGHAYDEQNTYTRPRGGRGCRQCRTDASARYEHRRKATRSSAASEASATN